MCHCYLFVQKQMLCKTDNQIREELARINYDGSKNFEDIILGLAVSMLLSTASQIRVTNGIYQYIFDIIKFSKYIFYFSLLIVFNDNDINYTRWTYSITTFY